MCRETPALNMCSFDDCAFNSLDISFLVVPPRTKRSTDRDILNYGKADHNTQLRKCLKTSSHNSVGRRQPRHKTLHTERLELSLNYSNPSRPSKTRATLLVMTRLQRLVSRKDCIRPKTRVLHHNRTAGCIISSL